MSEEIIEKIHTGISNHYGELIFVKKQTDGKAIYEIWLDDCFGLEIKEISKNLFEAGKKEFNKIGG